MSKTKTLNDLTDYIINKNGCWEWQGRPDSNGYGQMRLCGPKQLGRNWSHVS